ncbi:MAG TPA: DUF2878 domain-containing protein [Oleiagrimonas sp.]|nr:DUF2878 domain-containing protein [Oleiagrimonas sp.]
MMPAPSTTASHPGHAPRVERAALWANFIGYQAVWFCAVIAAAYGLAWPGAVACVAFVAWQLGASRQRRIETRLIAIALGCGLVLDGSLAASGWIDYAASSVSVPPGGAPLWILSLWASFALTVTQSLRYLQKSLWVAALFGVVGGPLAYWCASRAWSVVVFAAPQWHALGALALGWGVAMPLLAGVARMDVRSRGGS